MTNTTPEKKFTGSISSAFQHNNIVQNKVLSMTDTKAI